MRYLNQNWRPAFTSNCLRTDACMHAHTTDITPRHKLFWPLASRAKNCVFTETYLGLRLGFTIPSSLNIASLVGGLSLSHIHMQVQQTNYENIEAKGEIVYNKESLCRIFFHCVYFWTSFDNINKKTIILVEGHPRNICAKIFSKPTI